MDGLEPTPMVSCSSLWLDLKLCQPHYKTVPASMSLLLLQQPWYKGFTGTIAQTAPHQYTTYVQMRRGSTLSRRNQLRLVWSITHLPYPSCLLLLLLVVVQCVELFSSLLTNFRATESLQAILTLLDLWDYQVLKNWAYSRKTFVLVSTTIV